MANILSQSPLKEHPLIFINETTGDYVFALSQFATSLLDVKFTRETKAAFNALAIDFIKEHKLKRVTFSNARGLIFVKFDIVAINEPEAYSLMVLFALMAGCKLFNLKLSHIASELTQQLERRFVKTICPALSADNQEKSLDVFLAQIYDAPLSFGVSFDAMSLAEHNNSFLPIEDITDSAPLSLNVLCLSKLDNSLMLNTYALCNQVALAVRFIVMGLNPFKDNQCAMHSSDFLGHIGFKELHCFLESIQVPNKPRSIYPHSNELAKGLALNALKYVYFDAAKNGFGVNSFIECAPALVKHVASFVFDFKGAATSEFERFCNDMLDALYSYLHNARQDMINYLRGHARARASQLIYLHLLSQVKSSYSVLILYLIFQKRRYIS